MHSVIALVAQFASTSLALAMFKLGLDVQECRWRLVSSAVTESPVYSGMQEKNRVGGDEEKKRGGDSKSSANRH